MLITKVMSDVMERLKKKGEITILPPKLGRCESFYVKLLKLFILGSEDNATPSLQRNMQKSCVLQVHKIRDEKR